VIVPPLVLVPTRWEAEPLLGEVEAPSGPPETRRVDGYRVAVGLCGVGPIAAAAVTAHWIAHLHPPRVLLVGTAGSYAMDRAPVGTVVRATALCCEGLGVGEGVGHEALGFAQLPAGFLDEAIHDRIELQASAPLPETNDAVVLTTTTVAASDEELERRRRRHPEALVEEMEGFGVALACRLAGVSLTVLRGVSNAAGDRDSKGWSIRDAMQAARPALSAWLRRED